MKLHVGDRVCFLNETGEAQVIELLDDAYAKVLDENGFETIYPIAELVKISLQEREQFEDHIRRDHRINIPKDPVIRSPSRKKTNLKNNPDSYRDEINLHIEDLLQDYSSMSSGEILMLQLRYFTKELEKAIQNNKKKLLVIHGVGKGILKQEIRKLLDEYEGITYCDAPYHTHGYGATEVIIE